MRKLEEKSIITIREPAATDFDRIREIEQASFVDPWSDKTLADTLHDPFVESYLAVSGTESVAFIIIQFVFEDAHILTLAVDPAMRRRGVASELLKHSISRAEARGSTRMWLELRKSNHGARALYEQFGFLCVSERKRYYPNGEDAWVMARG